ncbi:MAG: type II toxin-antitoxin system RelE/ParE family toxin [Saprospiraceae bacterium]|nr:type II toxin-antitoxin system RelE/ParE family toxin [Saprospiraceae bacterium]
MAHRIVWNKRAINDLHAIIAFYRQNDTLSAAVSFNQKVKDRIVKLAENRLEGRKEPNTKTILFVLLGKHHRLYYRKIGKTIRIVCFFDTRQDPSKRPF